MTDKNDTESSNQSNIRDPQIDSEIQDPIEPGSDEIDERMTQDYREAMERSNNTMSDDRVRQATDEEAQDQIEPGSDDIDERITQDYREAMEHSNNTMSYDCVEQARPQTSNASNAGQGEDDIDISWRPDPPGQPGRRFQPFI